MTGYDLQCQQPSQRLVFLLVSDIDCTELNAQLPKMPGYESEWCPESPYWNHIGYHRADVSGAAVRTLYDSSAKLSRRLGCRDYACFDFQADVANTVKLLEVNPNAGWCWDGNLNIMAEYAGMHYTDLLQQSSNQIRPAI